MEIKTKTPVVSIIMPIYNAADTLPRCLDSISAQTFTGWECLLVIDGSPDGSGAIAEQYAASDNRFKVFYKENGG